MNYSFEKGRSNWRILSLILAHILCVAMLSACYYINGKYLGRSRMEFSSLLAPMQKSSIIIKYDTNAGSTCPVGTSKIGGKPDLPSGFEWFYYEGTSYEDETANRPLSFLAQINCEEASKYDKDSLLPSKGMLYFFYEFATMTWGFYPQDKGSARVYYFPGDTSELSSTGFPSDLLNEYRVPEMPITFSSRNELPDFEEFIEWHKGFNWRQWDAYNEVKHKIVEDDCEESISKILGYANLIQGGMLLQCEQATSGSNTATSNEASAQQIENSTKWQLLFQLDSIETEQYEMLWGDVGRLYFYINSDDLRALNFDNCWLILQCG
jgi:uncharacterized protein YwqG